MAAPAADKDGAPQIDDTLRRIADMEQSFESLKTGFTETIQELGDQLFTKTEELETGTAQHINNFNNNTLPLRLLPSHDLQRIADYFQSPQCRNISILAGAGISVSAGIPDFRSANGFYNTLDLAQYPLTAAQRARCESNSEHIFSYALFRENPDVYITARRDIILAPGTFHATLSHWFLRLLHQKGLLKRYYSTNIDGLDAQIGLPDATLCNVHGTLAKAVCIKCDTYADMRWFREQVRNKDLVIFGIFEFLNFTTGEEQDQADHVSAKGLRRLRQARHCAVWTTAARQVPPAGL